MAKVYEIVETSPQIYSELGSVVNGFLIRGRLTQYDEPFTINVAKMDTKVINDKILALVRQREMLDTLGDDGN